MVIRLLANYVFLMTSNEHAEPPYTRTGDDGATSLADFSRVAKTDPRLVAYASCEEASATIGSVIALSDNLRDEVITLLARVQNDLFDLGSDLTTPSTEVDENQLRIDDGYTERLEEACDEHNRQLSEQRTFIVPGGTVGGSLLHTARAVVRRAERATWAALEVYDDINPVIARYLNRLADLLFILAREANVEHGDNAWQPGLSARLGLFPAPPTEE